MDDLLVVNATLSLNGQVRKLYEEIQVNSSSEHADLQLQVASEILGKLILLNLYNL